MSEHFFLLPRQVGRDRNENRKQLKGKLESVWLFITKQQEDGTNSSPLIIIIIVMYMYLVALIKTRDYKVLYKVDSSLSCRAVTIPETS